MSDPTAPFEGALTTALQMFERGARQSGRTSAMIAQLKPGHVVVTSTQEHARHLKHRMQGLGVQGVKVVVADPKHHLPNHPELMSARRATTADHEWVYRRFMLAIEREAKQIREEIAHVSGCHLGLAPWPAESWTQEAQPEERGHFAP